MLRRKDNFTPDLITLNGVSLNRSTYELVLDGKVQTLSGKEFQVAEMLMSNPYNVIATEQLITRIRGWDGSVDTKARTSGSSFGIGLSLAQSIVVAHDGEISAYKAGQGRIGFKVVLK